MEPSESNGYNSWCNCYYFAKFAHATEFIKIMNTSGHTFGIAAALTRYHAANDPNICPYRNCWGGGTPPTSVQPLSHQKKEYNVYREQVRIEPTEKNGYNFWCNCYYFAKFAHATEFTTIMNTSWLTYSDAAALIQDYVTNDPDICPNNNCWGGGTPPASVQRQRQQQSSSMSALPTDKNLIHQIDQPELFTSDYLYSISADKYLDEVNNKNLISQHECIPKHFRGKYHGCSKYVFVWHNKTNGVHSYCYDSEKKSKVKCVKICTCLDILKRRKREWMRVNR